jgi:methylated-DNA-[protein]-cysteine S-methyltransferase
MKINRSQTPNLKTVYWQSPAGLLEIQASDEGLRAVSFVKNRVYEEEENSHNQLTIKQLQEYFAKKRTDFDLLYDLEGTNFQKRVWLELLKIPFGKTKTYMDIAVALGDPKVIRAAASANGANKIGIIIPCHRVIGSDGSLTGYAGGLDKKKWLLEFESPNKQASLFD